jgi:hypothetical protein
MRPCRFEGARRYPGAVLRRTPSRNYPILVSYFRIAQCVLEQEFEAGPDEIRRAHKSDVRDKRRKLSPNRRMDYEVLEQLESFYADLSDDLAKEIRESFIPNFSNWKDHDSFEKAIARLLKALKAEDSTGPKPS